MLDIASNRIKKIENISHLTELQEFWVSAGWSCSLKYLGSSGRTLLTGGSGRVLYVCVLN